DVVTLGCLEAHAEQQLAELDSAPIEYTVTAMPLNGPGLLLDVAARTVLPDVDAAQDYLTRLRGRGVWLDQHCQRLRIGGSKGRLPVAPLVEKAITWADGVLLTPIPDALVAPEPPTGWRGESAWRQELDALVVEVVRPALTRWVDTLRELLPRARPAEQPG